MQHVLKSEVPNYKITQIGHGILDGEHMVFCVVDHYKMVISVSYRDKEEYGMYWFENWCEKELSRTPNAITFADISMLDRFDSYSAITRIEKPKPKSNYFRPYEVEQYIRSAAKVGRNDKCPCESGRKYKQCCISK